MAANSRFSVSIHIMAMLAYKGSEGATYSVERNKEGEITRACAPVKAGTGCPTGEW